MPQRTANDDKGLGGLIDTFYDAAIAVTDHCAWCDLLPKVCSAFQASAGSFLIHDFSAREGSLRHPFNIRRDFRDAYNDGLSGLNPWMGSMAFYEEGAVVFGEDIVRHGDMVRTEFYNSYLQPQDLLHHLCGVIERGGHGAYLISLLRPPGMPPFSEEDKAGLSDLLPHLKRSIKVRETVVHDRLARDSLSGFIDLLPLAFLLVARNGRVELQNRVAREMIAAADGLFVGAGGYLSTASGKNTADLRRLIARIAEAAAGVTDPVSSEHFVISRGADRLPLVGVMYPANGTWADDGQPAAPSVAMLVKDPQSERLDSLREFVAVYELTNAEARLIKLLTAGHGLFEAAAELGISKNTARTHMRNVYAKVGTHRQADLIRLFTQFSVF